MEVDLHTHTTASDGTISPRELVALAKGQGLRGLAITDHDTVEGISDGLIAAQEYGLELLPGIELSTSFGGYEIHILGYLIDWQEPNFQVALAEINQQRLERAQRMLSRLSQLGLPLGFEEVKEIAGEGVIGRPHLATAMVNHGYVNNVREAFTRFLGKGALAYVPREKLSFDTAINLLFKAKGIPVLAHPGLIGNQQTIPLLIEKGLMGIEVYYPEHSNAQTDYYLSLCRSYNLIPTGGSDFHGSLREAGLGSCRVEYKVVGELKKKQEESYA